MNSPKDRLEVPYKATSSETVDLLTGVAPRMVNSDGPLLAWSQVADVTANGASKYARGDWRTRSQEYFLPKILRHLIQHYGNEAMEEALDEVGVGGDSQGNAMINTTGGGWVAVPPVYLDAESGMPHLARAATNILMCLENCSNFKEESEVIPPSEYGMVYLASPYTVSPELSCEIAREIVAGCVADGVAVYAPTLYGHVAAKDGSYDYWVQHGLKLLSGCDSIVFVKSRELGPWEDSAGCLKEREAALGLGLKMYEFDYDSKVARRL